MSDSEHSIVTYTSVPFPVKDDSDISSLGIDGPPIMPEDLYSYILAPYEVPPSPDYISGPEARGAVVTSRLDFVPGTMYPEYMPRRNVIVSAEELPLHAAAGLTTADSPGILSIRDEPSISLPPREEVERLLALTTPPPSPLTPLSSPLPHIPSPHYLSSPPPIALLIIKIPGVVFLRRGWHFASPTLVLMVGELDYDITDTWDDLVGAIDEIAPTTLEGVNQRVTDLATIVEQETTIMYGIMEDAQDDQSQLRGLNSTCCIGIGLFIVVQLTKTLRLLKGLQTQMVKFQRQHGPTKGPAQPDAPGEAGSSSLNWLCCSYAMQPIKYYGVIPSYGRRVMFFCFL
ncbi:hypothetical protein Tco_0800830 [Tanacetum coccineum]|uniref:Uncharacterized protein n=1 Tax=Tanacetum coccineum TaxID=301880 RepID=A0ABQ4ZXM1_9ASTR